MEKDQLVSINQLLNEWEAIGKDLDEIFNKIHENNQHAQNFYLRIERGKVTETELQQEIRLFLRESADILNQGEATLKKYKEIFVPYLKAFPSKEPRITEFIKSLEENIEHFREMLELFLENVQPIGES